MADLLLLGLPLHEIGARLSITSSTVSTHIRRIRAKFGATSTVRVAVLWAQHRMRADLEYDSWGRT